MIGYLKGTIKYLGEGSVVVETQGVGYLVHILNSPFKINDDAELHIHTVTKENEISLWGFSDRNELSLFVKLINVSGVGAKTGQLLISQLGISKLCKAITGGKPEDIKVKGVGKKTAQKIILELKDKLDDIAISQSTELSELDEYKDNVLAEVFDALESLGYTSRDIEKALEEFQESEDVSKLSSSDIIKKMLTRI